MALTAGNKILASDFVNLKNRVKAEMSRRNKTNSLAGYASTAYDYTVTPSENEVIAIEHINKIIEPINAIKSTGFDSVQVSGATIKALDAVDTQLAAYEAYPMYGSGTDCEGGCAGLCSSACTGSCINGCTNSCSGCGGACSSSCSGCSGSCSGTCKGGCDGCSGGCTGSCKGCSGGCSGCSGCGGSCSSKCASTCTWGCAS